MAPTVLKVRNAKPGRHADGKDLYLFVKPSGARPWVLSIQSVGRRRDVGLGSVLLDRRCAIVDVPRGEQQNEQSAQAIADRMELRVQAAFGAPDTSGKSPPFKRIGAVRYAFKWVASILIVSGSPAFAASSAKMQLNTLSRIQRMKRL